DECRNTKISGGVAIVQHVAPRPRHRTTGRGYQRMSGCHIPLAGRREPRIDIRDTFGDPTEFECRTARDPVRDTKAVEHRDRSGIEMGSAYRPNDCAWRCVSGSDRLAAGEI